MILEQENRSNKKNQLSYVLLTNLFQCCSYEEEKMREFAVHLLVLSHAYAVGQLKRLCEHWLETKLINSENVVDIFQLALLCDAPRLSIMCHRFIVTNIKAVQATDGWQDMRTSHPVLEKELIQSLADEDAVSIRNIHKANDIFCFIC